MRIVVIPIFIHDSRHIPPLPVQFYWGRKRNRLLFPVFVVIVISNFDAAFQHLWQCRECCFFFCCIRIPKPLVNILFAK